MGTQALVSVVNKSGAVLLKIFAGYNGDKASSFVEKVNDLQLLDESFKSLTSISREQAQVFYDLALSIMGGQCSLVAQYAPKEAIYLDPEEMFGEQEIFSMQSLFENKFSDPNFNSRWDYGTADYTFII
jgi:hypothetical protein